MTGLILASTSAVRGQILKNAGIDFETCPPHIDEAEIKATIMRDNALSRDELALILAQAKATKISPHHPGCAIIGADQILECAGEILDKPKDMAEAKRQLIFLRGKTHVLVSAVCCAIDGEIKWTHTSEARLTMRRFSNEFLGKYMADVGAKLTETIGGYALEGTGVQLLAKIDGDYFTVLGLPLMPLLKFLRSEKIISS